MKSGALPIPQQIAIDLFFPPVGSVVWWLLSRGWVNVSQGGHPSERSLMWLRRSYWVVLGRAYCLMFGVTGYAYFFR